ncbi:MAG: UDP-N-acetylglucosamine 2-epimerase, partial [Candidatus Cloacimonetes bacterium]|nr:UDP-N-acetylglucosamine 2-epimerase [Candidatus Cloacimonadota bacterium]
MKIITIIGTRPQLIKSTIVSQKLREAGIKEIVIHTGQHYDNNMSGIFFDDLKLPKPDYFIGIRSDFHGDQTGKMLIEIEKILMEKECDFVLVYGDSNTTLAGVLAAIKLHIPVVHIEAGLRSYNKKMPEEINRIVTDHISQILFAPTDFAVTN